jgi:hypothetical protein
VIWLKVEGLIDFDYCDYCDYCVLGQKQKMIQIVVMVDLPELYFEMRKKLT